MGGRLTFGYIYVLVCVWIGDVGVGGWVNMGVGMCMGDGCVCGWMIYVCGGVGECV